LGLAAMPRRQDGSVIDWGTGVMSAWKASERDALSALDDFLEIGAHRPHSCCQLSCTHRCCACVTLMVAGTTLHLLRCCCAFDQHRCAWHCRVQQLRGTAAVCGRAGCVSPFAIHPLRPAQVGTECYVVLSPQSRCSQVSTAVENSGRAFNYPANRACCSTWTVKIRNVVPDLSH
jgi:hypothetical protein